VLVIGLVDNLLRPIWSAGRAHAGLRRPGLTLAAWRSWLEWFRDWPGIAAMFMAAWHIVATEENEEAAERTQPEEQGSKAVFYRLAFALAGRGLAGGAPAQITTWSSNL